MASYKVEFAKSLRKDFRRIPKADAERILKRIQSLANDPRPEDSKKLKNDSALRIRIGNYRLVYEIRETILLVLVLKVGHRKDIYR